MNKPGDRVDLGKKMRAGHVEIEWPIGCSTSNIKQAAGYANLDFKAEDINWKSSKDCFLVCINI